MTKPSRWLPTGPVGWVYSLRVLDDDRDRETYYRRLCAYYVSEARRWHKVTLRSPEVQKAYEVLR